jgi:protein TonB
MPRDLPVPLDAPSTEATDAEPPGSETGTDAGRSGGRDDGLDGGKVGGTGADRDGCVGCTGHDPPGNYDQAPRLLEQARPVYPQDAFVKKVEGTVVVRILIGPDGRVQSARIAKSIPLLDDAALAAVRQWRFVPARHRGQPVAVYADAPVRFAIF